MQEDKSRLVFNVSPQFLQRQILYFYLNVYVEYYYNLRSLFMLARDYTLVYINQYFKYLIEFVILFYEIDDSSLFTVPL